MENMEENSEKEMQKKSKLKCEMIWKTWKKGKSNSDKIWTIWKKSRLNSENIWKIQKKRKLKCEMIWKISQALVARTYHPTFFSNFLFTNLFSIKFLYFFIISSPFPYFNLFVSIFIQSYVNIKLHVSSTSIYYDILVYGCG
jgi:hypothetical protein